MPPPCNSPGVLAYGGQQTLSRRDELNAICDGLPVPQPSIAQGAAAWGQPCGFSARPMTVSAAAWTSTFNNRHGGCFGAGSLVAMAGGAGPKPIERLRKGDLVAVPGGEGAKVACVVTYSGVATLKLSGSGLRITPWHPVRVGGAWKFPADVAAEGREEVEQQPEARVFNLVLESGHVIVIDGVEACTLAHGFEVRRGHSV